MCGRVGPVDPTTTCTNLFMLIANYTVQKILGTYLDT